MRLPSAFLLATLLLVACSSKPIPSDQALDGTYESKTLGIAFRYPKTFVDTRCKTFVSVSIREAGTEIAFIGEPNLDDECHPTSVATLVATINAKRVHDKKELQTFIDTVFPDHCMIQEESTEGDLTRVFLRSKNPPVDAPDFACGESIVWNRKANVAMFSALGSKTGGAPDWPANIVVRTVDGSDESYYDYAIMDSVEYLPE